jgi:seryl-tRNA synthetase
MAVPGKYQARLTVGDVTITKDFGILKDPRLTNVSQADLEEQFKLEMEIRDRVSEADDAVSKIREIKKALKDRDAEAKDNNISAAAERLTTRLSQVEEELYQVRNRSDQDTLNFQIKLNNLIAALGRTVATGDNKPTDQDYVVFKELNERLAEQQKRLAEALGGLAELNRALEGKGLKPIVGK